MTKEQDVQRYLRNRQKEIDGAALYRALAEAEEKAEMKEVYGRMAFGAKLARTVPASDPD